MQYKVPQNIDIEDKVIGFMTLRQFIVLLVGLMIGIIVYQSLRFAPKAVAIISAAPFVLVGGVVAFYKYNEKPLETFLVEASRSLVKARRRVWKKEPFDPHAHPIMQRVQNDKPAPIQKGEVTEIRGELDALAHLVDSGGYAGQASPADGIPKPGEEILIDTLMAVEQPKETLAPILAEAKAKVEVKMKKEEPKISQLASVSPFAKIPGYDYETTISDDDVNKILKGIREKEEQNVQMLSQAQLSSFHRNAEFQTE